MQKKRGSAIVIAILLITAIGAVGFSFGRILFLEVTNASYYGNAIGAYYAAESGLEEGFLRYRYQMSAEVPFSSWVPGENKVYRFDLTGRARVGSGPDLTLGFEEDANYTSGDLRNQANLTKTSQYFDLRMGSKIGNASGQAMGNNPYSVSIDDLKDPNYGNNPDYRIARDETKKIELGNYFSTDSDLTLYFKPKVNQADTTRSTLSSPLSNTDCVLIEAKIIGKKADGSIEEKKAIIKNSNSATCNYSGIINDSTKVFDYVYWTGDNTVPTAQNIYYSTTLKWKIAPTVPYVQASLFLKPIGTDIAYLLLRTSGGPIVNYLNGANSVITSTGFYAGVARTLSADIDRQSGALYDLFDYVIYKQN